MNLNWRMVNLEQVREFQPGHTYFIRMEHDSGAEVKAVITVHHIYPLPDGDVGCDFFVDALIDGPKGLFDEYEVG